MKHKELKKQQQQQQQKRAAATISHQTALEQKSLNAAAAFGECFCPFILRAV